MSYVRRKVVECDFSDNKYDEPVDGCAVIARGASGRWCEVMHMGPEYMAEADITPLSYEEAVRGLQADYPNDRIDF